MVELSKANIHLMLPQKKIYNHYSVNKDVVHYDDEYYSHYEYEDVDEDDWFYYFHLMMMMMDNSKMQLHKQQPMKLNLVLVMNLYNEN